MHRFKLVAATLAVMLSVSSCIHTVAGIGKVIDQIIAATREGCKFVPAVDTVVKLIAVFGGPNAAPVTEIAQKICAVVKTEGGATKALPPGSVYGYVQGVPVRAAPPGEMGDQL